jgi:hypothetical protein
MLNLKSLITPSALLAAFTLAGSPALAQERYHGRQNPSGEASSGRAAERAQPRGDGQNPQAGAAQRAERRREAPPAQQAQPQQRQEAPRVQPAQPQQRQEAPRVQSAQPRQADQSRADNRGNESRGTDNRRVEGRAVPRDNNVYANRDNNVYRNRDNNVYRNRGNVYAPHNSPRYSSHYTPRGYGYYGSRSYYRPYVFRPRFSIGFGIYAGYPVPYTYSYPYPILVYGYRAPRERVIVSPGSLYYGGIALEMTPYDADVFVDGEYAGRVEDFDGATQPLTLTAGMHEIEVQAQGYEPMRMNVEIHAGQVIPYRGDLRPY